MNALRPIVVMVLLMAALSPAACGRVVKGEPISPKDGVFAMDYMGIGINKARFYSYRTGGKTVVFFVARGSNGEIKTAFDACQTCYPHKMGYRGEKDCVVCGYCGMQVKIDELDRGIGNCVPVRLAHRLSGSKVLISQKDVEGGAGLF